MPIYVLGQGSNLLVPDEGVRGLVIYMGLRGINIQQSQDAVEIGLEAGESWDHVVSFAAINNWFGIEAMSGIPGKVGAAPVQNIGAYGQEISDVLKLIRAIDVRSNQLITIHRSNCDFRYRYSIFKRYSQPYIITDVLLDLHRNPVPIHHLELRKYLGPHACAQEVRNRVMTLRKRKSMLVGKNRSVGSFFINPILSAAQFEKLKQACLYRGLIDDQDSIPSWKYDSGRIKVSAAWLMEKSGFKKGLRRDHVGISSSHALALVHHGGGSTDELLKFAKKIQAKVYSQFDVFLQQEPRMLSPIA